MKKLISILAAGMTLTTSSLAFSMLDGASYTTLTKISADQVSERQSLLFSKDLMHTTIELTKVNSNALQSPYSVTHERADAFSFLRSELRETLAMTDLIKKKLLDFDYQINEEYSSNSIQTRTTINMLAGNLARFFVSTAQENLTMSIKFDAGSLFVKIAPIFAEDDSAYPFIELNTWHDLEDIHEAAAALQTEMSSQ